MKRCLGLIVIVLLSGPLAVFGQPAEFRSSRLAAIDDPLRVEFQDGAGALTKEKIRQVIESVAASGHWKLLAQSDGRFELTRTVGNKHTMRIELIYDPSAYYIRYLESANLLYKEQERSTSGHDVRAIHKNYNVWIRELASAINAALGVSSAYASTPPRTPLPENIQLVAPAADLPAAVAAYSGVWAGTWNGRFAHTLVVERIEGRSVSFIYSFEPALSTGWRRVAGTIGDDGVLRGTMLVGASIVNVSYKLSADRSKLLGEYSRTGRTWTGTFERRHLPVSLASDSENQVDGKAFRR